MNDISKVCLFLALVIFMGCSFGAACQIRVNRFDLEMASKGYCRQPIMGKEYTEWAPCPR